MHKKKQMLFRRIFSKDKFLATKRKIYNKSQAATENFNVDHQDCKLGADNQHPGGLSLSEVRKKGSQRSLSALLAAKQACDDWGLQDRKTPTFTKTVSFPHVASPISGKYQQRNKTIGLRGSKSSHPSYKSSEVKRSSSMKERREAKEKALKKYCGFSTSLTAIQEMDEP